jgi:hypothetical protein
MTAMPKTAVQKNGDARSDKNKIRMSVDILRIPRKTPQAPLFQNAREFILQPRPLAAHGGHNF